MDQFTISAKPKLIDAAPIKVSVFPQTYPVETNSYISVQGKSFLNIRGVYLSGSNPSIFPNKTTYYNPFSAVQNLSANNPGFTAAKVENFLVQGEYYIVLEIPELYYKSGYVDIIVENEAGYGLLSRDCRVPFLSTFPGAINIQSPCISGIYVKDYSVLGKSLLFTIDGLPMITINGNNLVVIR